MSYRDIAIAHIMADEGKRTFPYVDTVGKITIGIGYNLTDRGLPDNIIDTLFDDDLMRSENVCRLYFPSFDALSDNRKAALIDMAFDLDHKIAGFKQLRAAVAAEDWKRAGAEILDSEFALQVGARAQRLADMMEEG